MKFLMPNSPAIRSTTVIQASSKVNRQSQAA